MNRKTKNRQKRPHRAISENTKPKTNIFGFDFEKPFEYENGFYLTSATSRIAKSVAQYELYKKIVNLPGDVVECGVFKGASLIRFATYREMLESQFSRKILGFDVFGKFPDNVSLAADKDFIKKFETESGDGIPKEELQRVLEHKNFQNIVLVEGFLPETFSYFEENSGSQIALLHIDVDTYEATKACLEHLYKMVVKGGIIVFDDYGQVAGATQAINEYMQNIGTISNLNKIPYYSIPAYFVKE